MLLAPGCCGLASIEVDAEPLTLPVVLPETDGLLAIGRGSGASPGIRMGVADFREASFGTPELPSLDRTEVMAEVFEESEKLDGSQERASSASKISISIQDCLIGRLSPSLD